MPDEAETPTEEDIRRSEHERNIAQKLAADAEADRHKAEAENFRALAAETRTKAQIAQGTVDRQSHETAMNKLRKRAEKLRLKDQKATSRINRVRHDRERAAERLRLHTEGGLGVFHFNREVSTDAKGFFGMQPGTVEPLIAKMTAFATGNPKKPITLVLTSPGGSFTAGMHLFGTLRGLAEQGHTITTVISGYAASMAGILTLAADRRLIRKGSQLMIHKANSAMWGPTHELEDALEHTKEINDWFIRLYAERSGGKTSVEQIEAKVERRNWWMWDDEALERGFVDEIVGHIPTAEEIEASS